MAFFLLCLTVFVMFFQPVFVFPQMEPFQPLKNLAIISLLFFCFSSKKSSSPFFANKVNVYFVAFVAFQVVSSFQIWWASAWEIFNYWLRIGIIYYLIFKSCTTTRKVLWLCAMVALGVAFLSYTSYVNFVVNYMPGQRAEGFGWYENPNDLAIILVSVIPLLLLLANQASFWLGKLLFLAVAAMYAGNILFTASRNGLLGLSVAGFLCAFFSNTIPRVIRMALIVALGVAVIVVGGANVLQRKGVTGLRGDDSSEDRIIQWKAAGRMVMSRPLLGVGPGEFTTYAVEYGGIRGLVPHNTIIQVFAETGVIGGLFFVLFGFTSVLEAFRYIRSRKDVTDPGMCFLFVAFALVGFWVCAFFSNRYEFYILYVLVALMSAIKINILSGDQSGA